jgi:hypothetical protein
VIPLISAAAAWPGAAAWRPAGWASGLAPEVLGGALARSRAADEPLARHLPPEVQIGSAVADLKLLRDCWATYLWVWRDLACPLIGPPAVDSFWNPWSTIHEEWAGVRLLDGREGRDGFDPANWGDGAAYVNGPHSDNTASVAAAVAHARRGQPVAVVAPLDGCEWAMGALTPEEDARADLLSADLLILLGRVAFRPPPGISESGPRQAYALALWGLEPAVVAELAGRRIWSEEAGRELVAVAGCGDAAARPPPSLTASRALRRAKRRPAGRSSELPHHEAD